MLTVRPVIMIEIETMDKAFPVCFFSIYLSWFSSGSISSICVLCGGGLMEGGGAVVRPPGRSLHQVTQRKRHKERERSNKGIKRELDNTHKTSVDIKSQTQKEIIATENYTLLESFTASSNNNLRLRLSQSLPGKIWAPSPFIVAR